MNYSHTGDPMDQDQHMADSASLSEFPPPKYEESDSRPNSLPPIQIPTPQYSQASHLQASYPQLPLPHSISGSQGSTPQVTEDMVAAEALTRLNGTPPPMGGIATPMSNLSIEERQHPLITKVNQVSRHPIVRDAFKYYETSKRNYPHFNYAAGIVEAAALPVVNKIELNLNNRHKQHRKKRKLPNKKDKTETRKRLQFCLHILKLANDQINNQVNFLQTKIGDCETRTELRENNESKDEKLEFDNEKDDTVNVDSNSVGLTPTTTSPTDTSVPIEAAQQTKTEIITTVKKIIHVISNFKASSLSNDAVNTESNNELKSTIRDIILKLPSQIQQTTVQNSNSAQQANDKILVFAKDSLDMIGRLTNVFNDQLEKAESWIGDERGATPGADTPLSQVGHISAQSQSTPEYSPEQKVFGDNKIQS